MNARTGIRAGYAMMTHATCYHMCFISYLHGGVQGESFFVCKQPVSEASDQFQYLFIAVWFNAPDLLVWDLCCHILCI